MTRPKQFLALLWICAACLSACDNSPAPQPQLETATLILTGGKIETVDAELGTVAALAVRDHEIIAVGSVADIDRYRGPATSVINLEGRLVVPGFIEGHGHYLSYGRAQQILDLGSLESFEEIVELVAASVDRAQPGQWIHGRGWHQEKWSSVPEPNVDGVPLNTDLNRIAPDNPVLLGHASGHAVFANEAALAAAGVDDNTPDPAGGTIVRTEHGRASGLLRESAQMLLQAAASADEAARPQAIQDAILREQVKLAGQSALRHGVTSFHDAGSNFATIDFLHKIEAEGGLPVRLYVMIGGQTIEELSVGLPTYYSPASDNDFLVVRSIKTVLDGALGSHGAWLLEPYQDINHTSGLKLLPIDDLKKIAELAISHGYQLNTHAIGTRANRETLDVYQSAFTSAGGNPHSRRWRIEHAQHIHPDDIPRFGELGVIAAIQGIHATSDGPWIAARLGANRTRLTSYRWRDLLDTGAVLNNGTDVPVEAINPILSFYSTVSRMQINGEKFFPEQAISRAEALKSYTLDNAFSAFEETGKGSITSGKLADLVVLSRDILTIPEEQIPDTVVDYTIVGGNVVYQRSQM
ncbi:MAG: amidohydrolase [Proteobacteria bacterium]|nr:amidohydrolase [Pseudomonadota bacterium]